MDSNNLLGLYFTKDTATVVCLSQQGKGGEVIDCFTVKAIDPEQPKIQALASLIAQGCEERKLSFSETAVAIDCSLFMQHSVHSEFTDRKQINATVRFDTEESLATDISEIALTFGVNSITKEGSNLTVFTAQKKILSEILLSLQQYNFDPITITPDVICLSKLIFNKFPKDEIMEGNLFAMLSDRSGYLIVPKNSDGSGSYESSTVRTFLVGPKQNRADLLAREIMMTTALFHKEEKINALKIYDSAGIVDYPTITDKTAIFARNIDFFGEPDSATAENEKHVNRIDFAIAYGAALSLHEKEQIINFRDDFSPYQGKKIRTQKALKFAMVSVTILLIAVGLYFQMNLFSVNRDIKKSWAKFDRDYEIVMGKPLPKNASTKTALKNLGNELNALKKGNEGIITSGTSISSKLTLVLKAFNKCAKNTDLNIKTINITEKNISLTGDTLNRDNTTDFFNVLKETGMNIKNTTTDSAQKTQRDSFNVSLEPTS